MTFQEIILHPVTNLPIEQEPGKSFRQTLIERIDAFGEIIDNSLHLSDPINKTELKPEIFKRRNKYIRDGIKSTIDYYYAGKISHAYQMLSEFMKESNLQNYLNKELPVPIETRFFRIRVKDGNYPLTRPELFHIPFEFRGLVASQRYSIPGLPSLYLSNSTYVAWEELRRPNIHQIQAIRLRNTQPLKLLDLSTDAYCLSSQLEDMKALYLCMTWPLVAACSIKVKNSTDTFKPEYIIPQLLLQWTNEHSVDGIKYSSTHVNRNKTRHKGHFYNVVLPVKTTNVDTGYCPGLSSLFELSPVLPMQLRQFMTSTDGFSGQGPTPININPEIQEIELLEGVVTPYYDTVFGKMELSFKALPFTPLF